MQRRTFMKSCSLITGACLLNQNAPTFAEGVTPQVWPGWREGELHIHFIFTGVGESMYHIYPDGTSLLLDAGGRNSLAYSKHVGLKPDGSRHSGEWVARYVQRVNPAGKDVDYMMTSHFHDDHCGGELFYSAKTTGRGEDYYLSGLTEVAEYLNFGTAYDRGFPDYNIPMPLETHECRNMRKFYRYMTAQGRLSQEKFEVGALDQIRLRKNPGKYADSFHIRNICANATVWTGEGTEVFDYAAHYPKTFEKNWNENTLSVGMTVTYGKFRYFTGGDISGYLRDESGNASISIEEPVGKAVGPVNVCKTNHHSYRDAMVPEFVKQVRPRVYITNVWDQLHLQDNTMTNMTNPELYPGERLVCPTWAPQERLAEYTDRPWMPYLAKDCGHIVLRVFDSGARYEIYYLDASDEQMRVKNVYGPFES